MRGTALAEGIGEELTRLPAVPRCPVVIAKPGISVSTKWVYDRLVLDDRTKHPDIDQLVLDIRQQNLEQLASHMGNILEDVTVSEYPVIAHIKENLMAHGALNAMMSGSGPTVFACLRNVPKRGKQRMRCVKAGLPDRSMSQRYLMCRPRERKMSEDLKLNMNAYLPLRDVVFQTLREAILKGDLRPGERLMELQLAAKLGVSRTPIREAIRMLEQEGLAVTIPRKGAEVARMTEKDMEDVLQIREALDDLAVQVACDKITQEQLERLMATMKNFELAVQAGDLSKIVAYDVEFHDVIYEATDNPKLVILLSNLREQIYRYRVEYLKEKENYPMLIQEHKAILNALKEKNKECVVTAMHTHIRNQAETVKNIIREQQE